MICFSNHWSYNMIAKNRLNQYMLQHEDIVVYGVDMEGVVQMNDILDVCK